MLGVVGAFALPAAGARTKERSCLGPEPQIRELITVLEVKGRLIKVQQTNFATCGF